MKGGKLIFGTISPTIGVIPLPTDESDVFAENSDDNEVLIHIDIYIIFPHTHTPHFTLQTCDFVIQIPQRTYFLRAESADERAQWLSALHGAILRDRVCVCGFVCGLVCVCMEYVSS